MHNKTSILVSLILFIPFLSCSPKIKTSLSKEFSSDQITSEEVFIIHSEEQIPNKAELVGNLKITKNGITKDCSYQEIIALAKETAKSKNANLIFLSELKRPDQFTECYRISGQMYVSHDPIVLSRLKENLDKQNPSRISEDQDYAIVHFYRPKKYAGSLVGFKVKMEDEVIGKVQNGKRFTVKIRDFGKKKFWAKTETEESIEIDIKKGEEYFVRCGLNVGIIWPRPKMKLIDNFVAIDEYIECKTKL